MRFNPRWRATLDDVLHELDMASLHYTSDTDRHWMRCAADDIAWYLKTERATMDWYLSLLKVDAVKLLRRMADADDKSRSGQIKIATEYLRRYCGYKG